MSNKKIKQLSKYVWSLQNENKSAIINWKIMKTIYGKATSEFCKLYLMEKLYILNALGDERCLNKEQNSLANTIIELSYFSKM